MPINRSYGRKIPPPLPAHRMLTRVAPNLPAVVDLRQHCGPIKNQGNLGDCVGHAFSSAIEWIFRAYLKQAPVLSPLYTYVKCLMVDGDFPQDNGSDGVTGCNVAITYGTCEDWLYPDSSQSIHRPNKRMNDNAAQYRMGAYHGLTGSAVAQSVLGDPVPWPVEIGFNVYESLESEEVARTGIYNPSPSEKIIGGHENLIVGYDLGATPTLRPAACPPAFLVQNSWASDWGLGGFYWMATSVLDDPNSDTKIVHSGEKWVVK